MTFKADVHDETFLSMLQLDQHICIHLTDKETRVQRILGFGGWHDDAKMPGFWFPIGRSISCTVHPLE